MMPRALLGRLPALLTRRKGEILALMGTFAGPAVNLVYGVLVVRYLTPDMAGLLATASLLPSYLIFVHLGVLNGMQRELPLALGAGDRPRAERILKVTTTVGLLAGAAGGGVCLLVGLACLLLGKPVLLAAAYFGSACASFAYPVTTQIDTGLRAENRFMRQGWAALGTSLIALITSALIPIAGVAGAIGRVVLSALGGILVRIRSGVHVRGGGWDRTEVLALARIGLPLMISGTLGSLIMVSDRTVVALMMTHRDMGEFSLAAMIVNSMMLVPFSLGVVLFPKIARAYGEHRSRRRLRRYVWISLIFNAATILPLSLICFMVVEPLVLRYFPSYRSGIPAAKLACVTSIFWVYTGVGSVIGVINRMVPYLCFLAFSLLLILGTSAVLIHLGHGIMGAAWARLAGTVLMCIFTITYSLQLTSREQDQPQETDEAR